MQNTVGYEPGERIASVRRRADCFFFLFPTGLTPALVSWQAEREGSRYSVRIALPSFLFYDFRGLPGLLGLVSLSA